MKNDDIKKGKFLEIQEVDLHCPFMGPLNSSISLDEELITDAASALPISSNVQMAAALVEQALMGRSMPLEVVYHKNHHRAKQAFIFYHRLFPARVIAFFMLVALPFLEVPPWCQGEGPHPCGDPKKYALSGIPYIQPNLSLLIETLCLAPLAISVALEFYILRLTFWTRRVAVYKVILLTAMMATVSASAAGLDQPQCIPLLMYLRVIAPIVFTKALRVCFRTTLRIVGTFVHIAVLLLLFVLLSAWLANLMFGQSILEFKDYRTALLNLFILLTTANNPNVWAAAYTADRRAFFFFFTYLVVGLFFLMNLVFSVIYSNYKAQIATEVAKHTTARQESLRAAFTLLDIRHQNWVDCATMIALFHAISIYRHISDFRERTRQLFLDLDRRGDFKIWQDEFEELCDVIANEVGRQPPRLQKQGTKFVDGLHCLCYVRHPVYDLFIWSATLASVVVAICEIEVKDDALRSMLVTIEFVFGWVYLLDAILKISVHGWKAYWHSNWNRFDLLLTILVLTAQTASFVHLVEHHWASWMFIARGLRVLVLVTLISYWQLMAQTLIHLIPTTAPILALQFLVCSLFSLTGMYIFGGKVYIGNPSLENSEYANGGFFAFNYNDYASSMVTSFNLCVVNNWYVFMDAYAAATGSVSSRLFFIAFWAIAVAFTLNVVVAFIVEAFTTQMEKASVGHTLEDGSSSSGSPVSKKRLEADERIKRSVSYYDLYEAIRKRERSIQTEVLM